MGRVRVRVRVRVRAAGGGVVVLRGVEVDGDVSRKIPDSMRLGWIGLREEEEGRSLIRNPKSELGWLGLDHGFDWIRFDSIGLDMDWIRSFSDQIMDWMRGDQIRLD